MKYSLITCPFDIRFKVMSKLVTDDISVGPEVSGDQLRETFWLDPMICLGAGVELVTRV